jgi:hypothetical protein
MDEMREIMEFYYRKGGKGLITGSFSAMWNGSTTYREKENFYLRSFSYHPYLGEDPRPPTPHLQWPSGQGRESEQTHAYTCANSQVP